RHAAKPAKAIAGDAHALKVGQLNPPRIADDHKFDIALAVNQSPGLPADLMRGLAELAGEFPRDDLIRRTTPLIQLLNAPQLVWFQTLDIAVETSHSPLRRFGLDGIITRQLWKSFLPHSKR